MKDGWKDGMVEDWKIGRMEWWMDGMVDGCVIATL